MEDRRRVPRGCVSVLPESCAIALCAVELFAVWPIHFPRWDTKKTNQVYGEVCSTNRCVYYCSTSFLQHSVQRRIGKGGIGSERN